MRNRLFRPAMIGALCAASGCASPEPAAIATDQYGPQNLASQSVASTFSPRVSSQNTVQTEHYQVPPDFDSDVALHPYTSVLGPCPEGGPGKVVCSDMIPPSHYNR
jgi:hypothetical protein